MSLHIRIAEFTDAEAIAHLSAQLGYPADPRSIEARLEELLLHPDHCVYVALSGEMVLAWIHGFYTLRVETDAFVEIGGLVVDEAQRATGIGAALVHAVEEWSRGKHCAFVRVRCNTQRTRSHAFYLRLGFNETKEQKVFSKPLSY